MNSVTGGLKIIRSGPLSLLQDLGRRNGQHLGFSEGGACDGHAFFWANYLLGNSNGCAALEITLGPFEAVFQKDTMIAICGADLTTTINNEPLACWSSAKVVAGDVFRCSPGNNGLRSYLAIANGFIAKKQFSSYSEVAREHFFPRQVFDGAIVTYDGVNQKHYRITSVPEKYRPNYKSHLVLRVIPSYQFNEFACEAVRLFFQSNYIITQNSDRMGYRLKGEEVNWSGAGILSEGIAFGSVQVPPDGQPIVLLNDRQTIGGYPKLGCVCKKDCYQLAQRQANQKVSFKLASNEYFEHATFNDFHPHDYALLSI